MWCVPELTDEYITKMEDVLEVYEPLTTQKNLSSAWMKSRLPSMRRCALLPLLCRAGKRDGTANTNDAGRPMFSAR
jgi:hypothetical protein